MQRLTKLAPRTERGGVAVVVAFLIVPLIGFAAIAIDVAAMWSDRQRLQISADAAALAIAQDCAHQNCGVPADTARQFTNANFGAGANAVVLTPALSPSTGRVQIRAQTVSEHLFAPVLGFDSANVSASAEARWGAPTGGRSAMPLAFSYCEWLAQTGGGVPSQTQIRTIYTTKGSNTDCTGPSNLIVPGGFGWVVPNVGSCGVDSVITSRLSSDTGANGPHACKTTFEGYLGKIVLLPIFEKSGGTGSGAWYQVYGYVAFRLVGYQFPSLGTAGNTGGCSKCLRGYFTEFVDLDDAFEYDASAPDLGATIVGLTG